jgi:glycosyltransferase involved in cell wall biosynthesis
VLRYPDSFNRWTRVYSRLLLPRLARAATRVIAVSEFTAREAVELLGVDERRVRVIPHGVDEPFAPEGLAANGEYLLAVGTVKPLKESRPLAEAARAEARGAAGGGTRPRRGIHLGGGGEGDSRCVPGGGRWLTS